MNKKDDNENFEELFGSLLKPPKDLKEAEAHLRKLPSVQEKAEELAFRQTVVNILILSGIVSENDLNASLKHFEDQAYEQFAKEFMELCTIATNKLKEVKLEDLDDLEEDDETNDNEEVAKA